MSSARSKPRRRLWNYRSVRECLGFKTVPKGYTPITEFSPDDVFIAGYPKSGNTWFQHLVAAVVHGVDPRWSPPLLANDLVPDVHFNPFYRRYSTPMFFKTHDLPLPVYRRVVYLLRDGRDVMVSYRHFLEAVHNRKLDFLELVRTGLSLIPCRWHEHVEAWHRNPYGADVLVIRYEDLVQQPVVELERFCRFIEISRDWDFLDGVAKAASFQTLRAKEAKLGMGYPDRWLADKFFFRRGKPGCYKDEMPQEVLDLFLKDAGDCLEQHSYPISELGSGAAHETFRALQTPERHWEI